MKAKILPMILMAGSCFLIVSCGEVKKTSGGSIKKEETKAIIEEKRRFLPVGDNVDILTSFSGKNLDLAPHPSDLFKTQNLAERKLEYKELVGVMIGDLEDEVKWQEK